MFGFVSCPKLIIIRACLKIARSYDPKSQASLEALRIETAKMYIVTFWIRLWLWFLRCDHPRGGGGGIA